MCGLFVGKKKREREGENSGGGNGEEGSEGMSE